VWEVKTQPDAVKGSVLVQMAPDRVGVKGNKNNIVQLDRNKLQAREG
jgi:hypothetical protein